VFIGDSFLQGEANITKSFNSTVESYLKSNPSKIPSQTSQIPMVTITSAPTSSSLNSLTSESSAGTLDLDGVQFFYNPTCTSCMKVLPIIQDYAKNNPGANIVFNDIATDKTAIQRFEKMRSMHPQSTIYAPALVVGKTVIQGQANITSNLNTTVEAYLKENAPNAVTDQKGFSNPVDALISSITTGIKAIFG
jgi:thiol-disulfide isomerase/thioredoxin